MAAATAAPPPAPACAAFRDRRAGRAGRGGLAVHGCRGGSSRVTGSGSALLDTSTTATAPAAPAAALPTLVAVAGSALAGSALAGPALAELRGETASVLHRLHELERAQPSTGASRRLDQRAVHRLLA